MSFLRPRRLVLALILSLACYSVESSNDSDDNACAGAPATAMELVDALGKAICAKTAECHGSADQDWIDGCIEDYVREMSAESCDYVCEATVCVLEWASDLTCDTVTQEPPCPSALVDCD